MKTLATNRRRSNKPSKFIVKKQSYCIGYGAFFSTIVSWSVGNGAAVAQQRFCESGDFVLENQQVIQNCRIGYRTLGKFNATKSNVILFATYFTGKSEDLVSYVGGKDKLLDSTRYFIILTDALGNGVSSSPSNSDLQPHGCQPSAPILSESKVDEDNLRRCCAPPLRAAVALIFQSSFAKIWQSIYCFA